MNEFSLINDYFLKLAKTKESLNFKDDCAIVNKKDINIINVDTIIEDRHFFYQDDAKSVAYKLLHTNLSDIASMGALPKYWTMAISIPLHNTKYDEKWFAEFIKELSSIQKKYKFYLIGGDTTVIDGPLTITANVFGISGKKVLKASTAKVGDVICVSGFIGDSYWGFRYLENLYRGNKSYEYLKELPKKYVNSIVKSYKYPIGKVELGQLLLKYATSCTDVSDGLWIDADKLCRYSGVKGEIYLDKILFSEATNTILHNIKDKQYGKLQSITGGGDYELLFTIKEEKLNKLKKECLTKDIYIQQIGCIKDNNNIGMFIIDEFNREIKSDYKGFSHF